MRNQIHHLLVKAEYDLYLPVAALLPRKLGRYLAKIRGIYNAKRERDWRIFSLKDRTLWQRLRASYAQITDSDDKVLLDNLLIERCIQQSYEEYEAYLIRYHRFGSEQVEYRGLEHLTRYSNGEKSALFVTGHFGCIYGFCFFTFLNNPLFAMTTNLSGQTGIHPSILGKNSKRNKALQAYLNGGDILMIETDKRKLIKSMRHGAHAVLVIDLPPTNANEQPVWHDFLGKVRGFANGYEKVAKAAHSDIVPYVSYFERGRYVIEFGEPNTSPFAFLEKAIRSKPELWWTTDLLGHYPIRH